MEWIHKEIIIGETACHECCCSNCGERVEKHEKQSEVL